MGKKSAILVKGKNDTNFKITYHKN